MTVAQGRRRGIGLVVVFAAIMAAVCSEAAAQGESTACGTVEADLPGPQGDRLEITFSDFQTLEVERTGERIRVKAGEDEGSLRLVRCSGPAAAVTTVDAIALSVLPEDEFDDPSFRLLPDLYLDLQEGGFAPGATDEGDGGSEIELSLAGPAGREVEPDLFFLGSAGSDHFTFDSAGANLNASEPSPDIDFLVSGGRFGAGGAYGGDGDDVLRSAVPEIAVLGEKGNDILGLDGSGYATGGRGNDAMTGGPKADLLLGGPGDDAIYSGAGGDLAVGGPGRDLLDMGPQRDWAFTADRDRDRVRCGSSRDLAGIDRRDRRKGCERTLFLTGTPRLFD